MKKIYETSAVVRGNSSSNIYFSTPAELGPFRPRRIVVPHDVSPHFLVTDVKVGRNSQLISTACVPASLFDETLPPTDLHLDLLPTDAFFTVSVTNTTPEDREFKLRVEGSHDPAKISPDGGVTLIGFGHTIVEQDPRYKNRELVLRIQPQIAFTPRRLHVPEYVLRNFRLTSLGKHPAFVAPPSPRDRFPTPDSPSESPLTSSADSASLAPDRICSIGSVELVPDPLVRCDEFLVLHVALTANHPSAFTGAVVGTQHWPS